MKKFAIGCLAVIGGLVVLLFGIVIVGAAVGGRAVNSSLNRAAGETKTNAGGLAAVQDGSSAQPAATQLIPQPTPVPLTPIPAPILLQGRGQQATNPFRLPAVLSVATFTHTGRSNFIVHGFQGDKQLFLVNTIGAYQGQKVLSGGAPVTLDIQADGAWTVDIEPIASGGTPALSGKGDTVSRLFTPPATGPWQIMHNGQRNFIVHLNCAGGTTSIENEIGPLDGSRVVQFSKGPCFWDIQADGDWSLSPRN